MPKYPRLSNVVCVLFMGFTIAWMTVSLPLVFKVQQQIAASKKASGKSGATETDSNINTEEEASCKTFSPLQEYLPETEDHHFDGDLSTAQKPAWLDARYDSYHGDPDYLPPRA